MRITRCLTILIFLISSPLGFSQDSQTPAALSAMVETERDFARRCGEVGIRASFMEYFADEAIVFRPEPVKYKEAVKDRPAPPNPLAMALEWEPIYGDMAAAGDMGYDTGPSVFIDNTSDKPTPQYGFFFSVWKKQADGNWKVVLDFGHQTNEPYDGSREFQSAPTSNRKAASTVVNAEAERANLLNLERAFSKSAKTDGVVKAFAQHVSDHARLHLNGNQPILGRDAINAFLAKTSFTQTWEPMFADVSQSGDLGYSYGSYELNETNAQNGKIERGYYARVWKKENGEHWKAVLDVTSPLPPEEK